MSKFNKDSKIKDYKLKYRVIKNDDSVLDRGYPIGILDLIGYMEDFNINNEIVEIEDMSVTKLHRNNGYGSKILQDFVGTTKNKIIILFSGLTQDEFETEPDTDTYNNILNRLENFYTKNGFVKVNDYIGNYEYMETFIYSNKVGKDIIEKIKLCDINNPI